MLQKSFTIQNPVCSTLPLSVTTRCLKKHKGLAPTQDQHHAEPPLQQPYQMLSAAACWIDLIAISGHIKLLLLHLLSYGLPGLL